MLEPHKMRQGAVSARQQAPVAAPAAMTLSPLSPSSLSSLRRVALAPRPHAHTSRSRLLAADPAALDASTASSSSSSGCPFASVLGGSGSSSAAAAAPAGAAAAAAAAATTTHHHHHHAHPLAGKNWRVVEQGQQLPPPPEGRRRAGGASWNPLAWVADLAGDITEVEQRGLGPFLLSRAREFRSDVFTWRMGSEEVVAVLDYEAARGLLAQDGRLVKGWNPPSLYAMLGESSRANMEQPALRMAVRKELAPGFTAQAVAAYLDEMQQIVTEQLEAWASLAGSSSSDGGDSSSSDGGGDSSGAIDLGSEAKALSFEFSTRLLVNFKATAAQKAHLRRKFDALFQGMIAAPVPVPGTRYSQGLAARRELLRDITAILQEGSGSGSSSGGSSGGAGHSSVYEHMVASRKLVLGTDELPADELAQAGINLIIAGNDTSGLGITAILGLLPLFPDVMRRLRDEQRGVVERFGGTRITRAALDAMPYADAVVKECLRLLGPANGVFKRALVDLEVCGRHVPAGSLLQFSFFVAQLLSDPALAAGAGAAGAGAGAAGAGAGDGGGEAPSAAPAPAWLAGAPADDFAEFSFAPGSALAAGAFRPERWLAPPQQQDDGGGSTAGAAAGPAGGRPSGLLTFGSGPHLCLGQGLFMAEAKVLVAELARRYELRLLNPEAMAFTYGFVPAPRSGTLLRVSRLAPEEQIVAAGGGGGGGAAAAASARAPAGAAAV